jgi:hypothetical protein
MRVHFFRQEKTFHDLWDFLLIWAGRSSDWLRDRRAPDRG